MISVTALLIAVGMPHSLEPKLDTGFKPRMVSYSSDSTETGEESDSHTSNPPIDTGALLKLNEETLEQYSRRRLTVETSTDGFKTSDFSNLASGIVYERSFIHRLLYRLSQTSDLNERKRILREAIKTSEKLKEIADDDRDRATQPPPHLRQEYDLADVFFPTLASEFTPYEEYYFFSRKARKLNELTRTLRTWLKNPSIGPNPN